MVFTVKCNIKSDNSGLKEVLRACKELKKTIKVGYLTNNELADKAAKNHFGGSSRFDDGEKIEVPPRPFITHAIDEFSGTILNSGNSFIEEEFTRKSVKDKMISVAQNARDAIKVSIEDVGEWSKFPHNSPRTVERKGFDQPLVDTGAMKNGVEYRIGE